MLDPDEPVFAAEPIPAPVQPDLEILAHRIALRYVHDIDPACIRYTFNPATLEQFVRAVGGVQPQAEPRSFAKLYEKHHAQVAAVYDKLHTGKIGAHWLWCVIEQIAAGVPEDEAMRGYGYYEPSKWLPIESAPKDGAIFLIGLSPAGTISERDRRVYEARWSESQQFFTSVNGFILFGGATHWQPLPAAPALAAQGGKHP